ncbi:hypothetical protein B0I33_107156 [Prauserella shujinwangii]|uniref:Magnesium transporter NIPA n=1 Tax=Prauserella shujinwangii TaxID=1453103 RepID=A0A2T0LSC8_9PSEU|nr:DMT family transporter [Prauserella shujinwangii]PRX46579.1 hypothetical protein B0I33_107156 [Prauserella shujinwangii]
MVYALSAVAALILGTGSVIQQRAAAEAPPEHNLSPKLLVWLAQRPLWLAGVGTSLVGNLVLATALGTGSVTVVETVFVVRLVFALSLAALWRRQRIPGRDWIGTAAVCLGIIGFLLSAEPVKGEAGVPDGRWALGGGIIVGLAIALAVVASRLGPARRAVLLGAGAGALYGLQAALTHTAVRILTGSGVLALLVTWNGYAVVAVALLGMLLVQSAYETAPLPASYPAVVTTELLASIAVGIAVLGGQVRTEPPRLVVALAGLAAMIVGISLLTTSRLVTGRLDELVRRQEVGHATRIAARLTRELTKAERARRPGPAARRVTEGVEELGRLCADLRRHRDAELAKLHRVSERERADLLRRDRELAEQERWIDEQAARLRVRADRLTAAPAGPGRPEGDEG